MQNVTFVITCNMLRIVTQVIQPVIFRKSL